jgi:hypothetical protein
LPRQNRPLVRDGRLQAGKKKRTDRSYLGGPARPAEAPPEAESDELESDATDTAAADAALTSEPVASSATATPAPAARPASRGASNRLPTSVRAIQQQGVRKRRELDVDALAERDTRYALHELRRILILTALVVGTLIVLAIVLR